MTVGAWHSCARSRRGYRIYRLPSTGCTMQCTHIHNISYSTVRIQVSAVYAVACAVYSLFDVPSCIYCKHVGRTIHRKSDVIDMYR